MNQLQKSLLVNALFSGISGVVLVVINRPIANLFGISNTSVFWIIGVALASFSVTIIYQMHRQNSIGVLAIILQDYLWVIGSMALLVAQPFEISRIGNAIIAAIAMVVLLMAINQAKALAQMDRIHIQGTKRLSFERVMKETKPSVWKVISNVANYHEVAPNVDEVIVISGEGEGMVRSCSHGKDSWTETCSLWEDEKEYAFEVNTAAPNYPYPFKFLKGTWKVEEINSSRTKVTMLFEFEYSKKFHSWLLHPILKGKFSKTAQKLLDNWQNQIEK